MFGPRKPDGTEAENQESISRSEAIASPAAPRPMSNEPSPVAAPAARSPGATSMNRRFVETSAAPAAPSQRRSPISESDRTLTVGKGLSLAGEIASCDILIVEGKVEAKLTDGKLLQIAESGQFRGNVEIENADIAGRYDGQLVVHGRLTVRATGRISGIVKYGELEVCAGGQIIGEMQVSGGAAQAGSNNVGFKSAAKFAAFSEDEENERKAAERKSA
ncbi:MAG: polymer-forming cytoskeletal protein [Bdellovibrionales bacterium]